ncbi:glycosyltransferase family 2 protein [Photobacterium sp. 53610]|uniref:glycosyltransferase family 2 protein n=1 Tax=Photobacterium sp. 53610 TaxID=3102789 RepID=UPI002ED9A950
MPYPFISAVIPAKDEAMNLPKLLDEVVASLTGLCHFEIVVVDDGSSDNTYSTCEDWGKSHSDILLTIVKHQRSVGQSTALLSAVNQAQGKWIVTMDGDGQNDPADIPALLEAAAQQQQSHFCIAGFRHNRQDTEWKRFQSRFANAIRQAVLKDGVKDTGCGLKLIPRETYLALPYFDHMHRFLPALIRRLGGEVAVVQVNHRGRWGGTSKYNALNRAWVGLVDMMGVVWLSRRARNPLIEKISQSGANE